MTSSEMTPADIAAVTGNRGDGGFGFGDGSWWIIILFLFGMFNGGWGNGGNGGGGLYPWLNNSNQINEGFQNQMINDNITSIREGVFGLQNQLSNGFAQAEIAENARQMADMNQLFNLQSAFQNCCCENRLATVQTQNIIQNEGAATRLAIQNQTQAIIDKLCQLEIDNLKQDNANLRTQLNMANLAASQVAQTAELRQNQATVANQLLSEMRSCPIPSQPVYGSQPIFTCGGNGSCGCGA
jgi:hypothetical protein